MFEPIHRMEMARNLVPKYSNGFWLDACCPYRDSATIAVAHAKGYIFYACDIDPREDLVKKTDLRVRNDWFVDAFHVITSTDTLEHINDYQAALRNLHAYLKAGGLLVLGVPSYQEYLFKHVELNPIQNAHKHCWDFSPSQLSEDLLKVGFSILGEWKTLDTHCELEFGHFWVVRKA